MKYAVMSNRYLLDILGYVNTRNDRGADVRIVALIPPLQFENEYTAVLEERREEQISKADYLDEIKADEREF